MSERIARMSTAGRGRARGARVLAGVALAASTLLAACEGDNLFAGDGPSFTPRILDIVLPEAVFAGDSVQVRVDAAARRSVSQVLISVRGAATRDTAIDVDPPRQVISAVVKVGIPELLQDTLLIVRAQIADAAGVLSSIHEDAVEAFGPPVVTSVSGPSGVRAGDLITLNVSAFGARRITRLDISARGAITRDTSVTVVPPAKSVSQNVLFQIPANVQDTLITFNVSARDEAGFSSETVPATVNFAIDPPVVTLLAPASAMPGTPMAFEVAASGTRKISELRLELTGALSLDTTVAVDPERSSVLRVITVQLPGSVTGTQIRAVASALDAADMLSETGPEFVDISVNPPIIVSINAPASVFAGHIMDATITAQGDRPIKEIKVLWRGYAADSLAVTQTTISINPPRNSVTEPVQFTTPCSPEDRTLLMHVTARDEAEALSPVASATVTVLANPNLCPPPPPVPMIEGGGTVSRIPKPPTVLLYSAPGVRRQPPR